MNMDLSKELHKYATQLSELSLRAKKINYLNKLPRLPKKPTEATMMGFKKRLSNWVNALNHLEEERMKNTLLSEPDLLSKYLSKSPLYNN